MPGQAAIAFRQDREVESFCWQLDVVFHDDAITTITRSVGLTAAEHRIYNFFNLGVAEKFDGRIFLVSRIGFSPGTPASPRKSAKKEII